MKITGLLLLSMSTQTLGNVAETELQRAVEQGLRSPVAFENEMVKTYSVSQRLAHYNVPAISFALIDDGKLSWAQAYGTLSAKSKEKATADTVFQAASIAKPVTAYAVMRMRDKGVLSINTDINDYLTSLTLPESTLAASANVTFKNLLDHSSGLTAGGYQGYEPGSKIPTDIQTLLGLTPAINKATKLEAVPGTNVRYSGAGYTLVEIALTDLFKQPFEHVMQQWVLSKLNMNNSSFFLEYPSMNGVQAALGHDTKGNEIAGGWRLHPEQAAAGLWSTPSDLAKLAINVSKSFNGQSQLLSQASAKEMLTRILPDQDYTGQFGGHPAMTFVVSGEDETFLFNHGGGTVGYRCFMIMYPKTNDGAVFMTNSDAGFGVGLEMLRAASDVYQWPKYKLTTHQRRDVDAKEQARFIGQYRFAAGWHASIQATNEADGLGVLFPNGDFYVLTGIEGEHNYVHEESGVEVSFDTSKGVPVLLLYNQSGIKQ